MRDFIKSVSVVLVIICLIFLAFLYSYERENRQPSVFEKASPKVVTVYEPQIKATYGSFQGKVEIGNGFTVTNKTNVPLIYIHFACKVGAGLGTFEIPLEADKIILPPQSMFRPGIVLYHHDEKIDILRAVDIDAFLAHNKVSDCVVFEIGENNDR